MALDLSQVPLLCSTAPYLSFFNYPQLGRGRRSPAVSPSGKSALNSVNSKARRGNQCHHRHHFQLKINPRTILSENLFSSVATLPIRFDFLYFSPFAFYMPARPRISRNASQSTRLKSEYSNVDACNGYALSHLHPHETFSGSKSTGRSL